ncbi:MAG: tetratricopeptide repeat protein [Nostocaceae cyanobacterium]|nr:tetratricopeptide repeat protein [Nostocaceae cyanobacterium]
MRDGKLEAAIWTGTANICLQQGHLEEAVDHYRKARKIQNRRLREIDKLKSDQGKAVLYKEMLYQKAAVLHELAGIYFRLWVKGNYIQWWQLKRADCLCRKSLKIKEDIRDKKGKATTLCQLAGICTYQNKRPEAISLYLNCLGIQKRIGHRQGEATTLCHLAKIHALEKRYDKAVEYCQKALKIYEDINEPKREAETLRQMKAIYIQNNQIEKAIECCKKPCEIEQSIKHIEGKAKSLIMLGELLANKQEYLAEALASLEEAQTIRMQLGFPNAKLLEYIAKLRQAQQNQQ